MTPCRFARAKLCFGIHIVWETWLAACGEGACCADVHKHAVEPLVRQPLAALEPREAAGNTAPRLGLATPDGRSSDAGRMLAPAAKPRMSVTEGAPCVPAVGVARVSDGRSRSRNSAVQEVAAAAPSGLASVAPGGAACHGFAAPAEDVPSSAWVTNASMS